MKLLGVKGLTAFNDKGDQQTYKIKTILQLVCLISYLLELWQYMIPKCQSHMPVAIPMMSVHSSGFNER